MNDQKLKQACEKMATLLGDPHPGLSTWNGAWRMHMLAIFRAAGVREDATMEEIHGALEKAGLI